MRVSAHDLAVALGIETDLVTPLPRAAFQARRAVLARYLRERLQVAADGVPCAPGEPAIDWSPPPEDLALTLPFTCPAPARRLAVAYGLFFDLDPAHRSLGRLVLPGGEEPVVFDRSFTRLEVDTAGAPALPARFARIFRLGVEHILTGWDHLLFLLALLLAARGLAATVRIVTAFTLAHSLTLALAWHGLLALPARPVEAVIAASIAWVAAENLLGRGAGRRWALAGAFGLVHGLGFYGALAGLGLGGGDAVTTLLAFNLGVEAGQVAVVALAWAPLVWWTRRPWYAPSARACSAGILLVALWWTAVRALSG